MTISLFLTWFGPPRHVAPQSPARELQASAVGSGVISWLALLAFAAGVAILVYGSLPRATRRGSPLLWVSGLILVATSALLTGFRLVNPPHGSLETATGTAIFTYELSRGAGVYLAAVGIGLGLIGVAAARPRAVTLGPVAAGIRLAWIASIPALVGVWLFERTWGAENEICMYECEPAPVQAVGFTAVGVLFLVSALVLVRRVRRHRRAQESGPGQETG